MTGNQLVAYNLRRARELRDLTQEQAAERLEPYLGRKWSKAVFSAAETSVKSDRVREFSADEILAFSRAFDVPLAWFFIPPHEADMREPVSMGGTEGAKVADLVDAVAPVDTREVQERLSELTLAVPRRELPERERNFADLATARAAAAIVRQFGHIETEAEHLRFVAAMLDEACKRAADDIRGDVIAQAIHQRRKRKEQQ
jgi:transcriptional regulator with XRE-family HTH domain